jgi:hypothetical protein
LGLDRLARHRIVVPRSGPDRPGRIYDRPPSSLDDVCDRAATLRSRFWERYDSLGTNSSEDLRAVRGPPFAQADGKRTCIEVSIGKRALPPAEAAEPCDVFNREMDRFYAVLNEGK